MLIPRLIVVAALVMPLGGCFFFYIPGSVIESIGDSLSGTTGKNCVSESSSVGSPVKMSDGRIGKIQKIEGISGRCQNPALPIRAVVSFD